jgi:Zn-dependent protease with chaperone function
MYLIAVGAAITAVAGLGLAIARVHLSRGREPGERPSPTHDYLALALALVAVTGLGLMLGDLIMILVNQTSRPPRLVVGMLIGVAFFLIPVIVQCMLVLVRWGTRRPLQLNSPGYVLRNAALTLLGAVAVGIVITYMETIVPSTISPILLIPFVVALFPLYQHSVKPRLVFPRSFEIRDTRGALADLVTWIRKTASVRRLGRIRVALIPGNTINAYATGMGWSGRWILLGEGLVKLMTPGELRWIAAHELAHLIRHDVPKLILGAIVTGSLHALILIYTVFPLYDAGQYFAGTMLGGVSGGLVLGALPGMFTRRIELATDQLGVRLVGDPEAACSALVRLADVTKQPPGRGSLTHPPIRQRIEAIRGDAP